jgi:hypothetical protein
VLWLLFAIVTGTPKECTLGPGHWRGTGDQYDIHEHWTIDTQLDLNGAVGTRVGTIAYPSLGCSGELVRETDIGGSRVVREHITRDPKHTCVDGGSVRFACKGGHLDYRYFYPDGTQCAVAILSRAP